VTRDSHVACPTRRASVDLQQSEPSGGRVIAAVAGFKSSTPAKAASARTPLSYRPANSAARLRSVSRRAQPRRSWVGDVQEQIVCDMRAFMDPTPCATDVPPRSP